jgi:hypothetical protein
VLVVGELADVGRVPLREAGAAGAAGDAHGERSGRFGAEHLRERGEDVEADRHGRCGFKARGSGE